MDAPSEGETPTETIPFPAIDDNANPTADSPSVSSLDERGNNEEKDGPTKKKGPSHRRSLSGNFMKLLRTSSGDRTSQDGGSSGEKKRDGSAMAGAVADSQRRKRKSSLRKTVLGKGKEKEKDRKGKSPLSSPAVSSTVTTEPSSLAEIESPTQSSTPRPSLDSASADSPSSSPEHPPAAPPRWQAPFRSLSRVSVPSLRAAPPAADPAVPHHQHTASTSSDDNIHIGTNDGSNDARTTSRDNPSQQSSRFPTLRKIPTQSSIDSAASISSSWIYPSVGPSSIAASISTAPSLLSDTIRRSTNHFGYFASSHTAAHVAAQQQHAALARSPLASEPQSVAGSPDLSDAEDDDEDELVHSYDLTAFWGYIILIVTYVVFVVGMGSCFGVWSWAWDVGETPYAPPELEDDASLPIVGYYPALMVLTAVMAWVWVVVAWVGMKYFRHSSGVAGDDG
jgi:hypothetical protein